MDQGITYGPGPINPQASLTETLDAAAAKLASTFMYQGQDAVDTLENANIRNEIQAAAGTVALGNYLTKIQREWNEDIKDKITAIGNASKSGMPKANAEYQQAIQLSQNSEGTINSEVQEEQSMTGQLAKNQQNTVQFAQIADSINSYLGNLLTSALA